jgi:beta-glucosidase
MGFPADFVWGGATSAYQVEGAAFEDGRGLSVWDVFCQRENAVFDGHTGAVACDHYHHYPEDVALFKTIGLQAYRFSINWTRVLPQGKGSVNSSGLAFYDRLVDELLAADITPYITLFHWDYPYDLYCQGGWLNPASPHWFADYTAVVVDRLSDRVRHWFTINEPQCFVGLGHKDGLHAPGDRWGWKPVLQAAHHVLLAHGRAVQVIRARAKTPPQVGFASAASIYIPASDRPADIAAAQQATFGISHKTYWGYTWFADPMYLGQYPADGWAIFGADVPTLAADDMATIQQPLDFFGCNLYGAELVAAGDDGQPQVLHPPAGNPRHFIQWSIAPECIYWAPRWLWERYRVPVIISENGLAGMDWVALDGGVHDPQRIDYLTLHLRQLERALQDGVDVCGYFQWSCLDNFEWQEGYKQRFGMIHVDYATQKRTLKDSAYWYRDVIATNGAALYARATNLSQ